jgi:hypothetical protein
LMRHISPDMLVGLGPAQKHYFNDWLVLGAWSIVHLEQPSVLCTAPPTSTHNVNFCCLLMPFIYLKIHCSCLHSITSLLCTCAICYLCLLLWSKSTCLVCTTRIFSGCANRSIPGTAISLSMTRLTSIGWFMI